MIPTSRNTPSRDSPLVSVEKWSEQLAVAGMQALDPGRIVVEAVQCKAPESSWSDPGRWHHFHRWHRGWFELLESVAVAAVAVTVAVAGVAARIAARNPHPHGLP